MSAPAGHDAGAGEGRRYVSTLQRLRRLPAVFSLHDLRMQGVPEGTERNAVVRWKAAGLIQAAGPKLGLYYNLLVDPHGPATRLGEAVRAVYGSAVIIGPAILHDHGWVTQPPQMLTLAVPMARSHPKLDGVAVYGRPVEWYMQVHAAVHAAERGSFQLPQLPPEFALADMLKHGDCLHGLKPDDFELPEDETDVGALEAALLALEVPVDVYEPVLQASSVQIPMRFR